MTSAPNGNTSGAFRLVMHAALPWVGYLLKRTVFWWCLFTAYRLVMLLVYGKQLATESMEECLRSLYKGISLDVSLIAYISFFPILIGIAHLWIGKAALRKWLLRLLNGYDFLLMLAVGLLMAGELATYGDWRSKINAKILFYLDHLGEGARAATTGHYLLFFGVLFGFVGCGSWIFWRFVSLRDTQSMPSGGWKRVLHGLPILALLPIAAIGARGSLGVSPVQLGDAFYSKNFLLNDVSTNIAWNFVASVSEHLKSGTENPYAVFPAAFAQSSVKRIYAHPKGHSPKILTSVHPNVILIIQEGITADVVGALGGISGITPQYDKLAREGLLFTNMYSSGWTSEVGHISILAGFPALPQAGVIGHPFIYRKLPSFIRSLGAVGYETKYYYGGNSSYANIQGYLIDQGVADVIDEADLHEPAARGRFCYPDGYMLDQVRNGLPRQGGPWCRILFTASTHSPYDLPCNVGLNFQGEQAEYVRSVYYADSVLGRFVEHLKADGQWENTLLVLVPDHSRTGPLPRRSVEHARYRIGMLLTGGAVRQDYRGCTIDKIVSQIDFAGTLLPQLGRDASAFAWSKDALDPNCPEFASFVYPFGMGWMRPNGSCVVDFGHHVLYEEEWPFPELRDSIVKEVVCYLQAAQQEYIGLSQYE